MIILASGDHVPSFCYQYIYLNGRLDMDRLARAVDQVAAIVPETLYRLDARRVRFKDAGFTARDAISETEGVLDCGIMWDLKRGTQVKISVGHGPDADSMIVSVSHVLMDGKGMIQYVSLLADAYNGVLPRLRNNRSLDTVFETLTFGPPTDAEKRCADTPSMGLPLKSTGQELFCRKVTFPVSTMYSLHAQARAASVTLNDVFFTACARVACQVLHRSDVALRCAVDIRPFVDPGPVSVANMTGLYRMSINVSPDDPFLATVQQVHEEVLLQKERRRYFVDFPSLAKACKRYPVGMLKRYMKGTYNVRPVEYSNCGVLPELDFGGVGVESAFFTGACSPYPEFPFSISSYAGATTFAVTLIGDEARADAAEVVLRSITSEMTDWVAGGTDEA